MAWNGTAEVLAKYFSKGRMAVVTGRLQLRDWIDKEGNKRRTAEVVADNVYFGDSKRQEGNDSPQAENAAEGDYGGFAEEEDDGSLPF